MQHTKEDTAGKKAENECWMHSVPQADPGSKKRINAASASRAYQAQSGMASPTSHPAQLGLCCACWADGRAARACSAHLNKGVLTSATALCARLGV